MIAMYACKVCLASFAANSSCLCGSDAISLENFIPVRCIYENINCFNEGLVFNPEFKVGDEVSYHVGSLNCDGVVTEISIRNNPYIDALYLYRVKITKSNSSTWPVGEEIVDDEMYFFKS